MLNITAGPIKVVIPKYGDRVPADEVENGRMRVGEGGEIVEQVSSAKSPEEQQRIAKLQREQKE